MIAYMHTSEFSTMIGIDYVPRIGEKLRLPSEPEVPDERDGLFQVQDVLYEVPNDPGRQRVDIYAKRVCDAPKKLNYDTVMTALYEAALFAMGKRGHR